MRGRKRNWNTWRMSRPEQDKQSPPTKKNVLAQNSNQQSGKKETR